MSDGSDLIAFDGVDKTDMRLKKHYVYVQSNVYPCCPDEPYQSVITQLQFERRGSYFYRLYVAPAAICMFVIPVIHFLPPCSNEKLTLGE